jgi:hypothetical protein
VSDRVFALSPNDLALWDQCRRCFYLAAAAEFPRPAVPNRLASVIGRRLLSGLQGARADKVAEGMPSGLVDIGRHPLRSAALNVQVPDRIHRCVIRGDLDVVLRLEGDACGVVEVVVGAPEPAALPVHARRLHAWAHAIETPAAGAEKTVRALGVLAFEPESDGPAGVNGAWHWTPIERDDASFFGFLAEALTLLARPVPPGGTALCTWCVYRDAARRTGY